MNAPNRTAAPVGSRDDVRQCLAEWAEMAAITASLITTFAAIGDDIGARYAGRRLIAYTKAIAGTLRDLDEAPHAY
jgi:hypothetical protein